MNPIGTVLVTGGAGYVGSVLVPRLLLQNYTVKVLDLYLFGDHVLASVKNKLNLKEIKGDIRDQELLKRELHGCDAVIHLACISNDPSFELNPNLSRAINYDAFEPLVRISKESGVKRFVYASTSSVYGISNAKDVTEEYPLIPVSDYNKYKGLCEPVLLRYQSDEFVPIILRPATICGYSPRQRLDLTVNILTNHAVNTDQITVFGGLQRRPNLHIEDMVDLYLLLLTLPSEKVAGKIYNVGYQNRTIADMAELVREVVRKEIPEKKNLQIVTTSSQDKRSYHISSEKIKRELNFIPRRTIEDAVRNLISAFQMGKLPQSMSASHYYNIKTMKGLRLA
ncbi:MAG: UDP-glucose 4-epimerase [Deltaproteobacteria bacterium RIFCSPLOWO2_01_44_7]|nr:MAG: UDP-glucose 4-epimerase [Deltaproteobacteria bacterium RIFCSPHIGHO2_01_FULL_43_49]OGQ16133.1 MAG: UDP-glucose 4-epimerase [Deltaproteobacteria bacterium RIFCSPHIGHO2_02_FULL_44_53]OGQ29094.1 MAG: UDP-glucose 4-epimerase [Deltaproteobacteria bacterium RIFCSPHIGHO2_12_FULL_44_21]OGQ32650.1 MAG: UDP-glucose 4-epimerase [Deltaproteobacteria bacterium RIFCSPLOWO2_01_FULL_45_74]OGQ38036.1 MAG: UDP-glucose 4-epimerase [Deltaproteobacteria bacterium RIFCSPLOWO2_01_44_7]OGQ41751.1 MAG: UDP-gluc